MNRSFPGRAARYAGWLMAMLVAGCVHYRARPLPAAPNLARSPALTVPANQFGNPGLKPHLFPTNGLDETAVITLALLNNPELKAARLEAKVADAQLLEAGLLPDPQVSGGIFQSPFHTGYSVELREDIQALITRGAAKAAAKAHAQQVNMEILWQEWQVAERARELFIQWRADDQLQRILAPNRDLLAEIYRQQQAALEQNNLTATAASVVLKALVEASASLRQLQLDANQTRHLLNQLLGLEPEAPLVLIGQSDSRPLSREQFQAAVAGLPRHRADLLALQAGYQSQEQRLREAILAQFPAMSAGVEQARGPEEGIHSFGFTVNVTLPLFNRNRGRIAIQQTTRAVLYQTYQARLDQAVGEADQIWQATQIMARQLRDVEARLPTLEKSARAAEQSFQQSYLEASAYVGLQLALETEQVEAIRLRASLEKAQAALQILLGLPLDLRPSP